MFVRHMDKEVSRHALTLPGTAISKVSKKNDQEDVR